LSVAKAKLSFIGLLATGVLMLAATGQSMFQMFVSQ